VEKKQHFSHVQIYPDLDTGFVGAGTTKVIEVYLGVSEREVDTAIAIVAIFPDIFATDALAEVGEFLFKGPGRFLLGTLVAGARSSSIRVTANWMALVNWR
jgi:hypothetical protein